MHVVLRDADGQEFEVGYDYFEDLDSGSKETLFWIESPNEVLTLKLEPKTVQKLVAAIQFIKDSI